MTGFDLLTHLLPNARAWRVTVAKQLREVLGGLGALADSIRGFFDGIYGDTRPQETRELTAWELQFALPNAGLTTQQRRDRLDATWKALGAQDPHYIQETLQNSGFDVYVHEWWEPVGGRSGGSVNGDVSPVAREPSVYLDDGFTGYGFTMLDGRAGIQDGAALAQDGGTTTPLGYPLVNRITLATTVSIADGSEGMNDGGALAQDGRFRTSTELKPYQIPADPEKYPFFLYIGGATFPDTTEVLESRRTEFEELCLKICPAEQWLGLLITYG